MTTWAFTKTASQGII